MKLLSNLHKRVLRYNNSLINTQKYHYLYADSSPTRIPASSVLDHKPQPTVTIIGRWTLTLLQMRSRCILNSGYYGIPMNPKAYKWGYDYSLLTLQKILGILGNVEIKLLNKKGNWYMSFIWCHLLSDPIDSDLFTSCLAWSENTDI